MCQGMVAVTEGESGVTSAPLSALAVPCSVPSAAVTNKKGPFQRQVCCPCCQPVFMSGQCLMVAGGWAAGRLGDTPAGGQLAPGSVALLSDQRLLPRGA